MKAAMMCFLLLVSTSLAQEDGGASKSITMWIDHVVALIQKSDVHELERLGQEWRGVKGEQPLCRDGQSRLMAFIFAQRRYKPSTGNWAVRFEKLLAKWAVAYPSSTLWRVIKAQHLATSDWISYSADDVRSILDEAQTLLLDSERYAGRTADWYTSALTLAVGSAEVESLKRMQGYRRPSWLDNWLGLVEEGVRRFPEHTITYFRVGTNAQRLGFKGGAEGWGRHVCRLLPQKGMEPYARLFWSLEPVYREDLFKKPGCGDWPTFRQGFHDLLANGANTRRNVNAFLMLARKAEDRATARQLLSVIADQPDPEIFEVESRFFEIKAWAESKAPTVAPLWVRSARAPQSVAWSRDGKTLFVGCDARPLSLLNSADGSSVALWHMQDWYLNINEIAVSPDGKLVAAVSGEELWDGPGVCRIWETATGKVVETFHAGRGAFHALAFGMNSTELVCGGGPYSGPSEVWHWTRGEKPAPLPWGADHKHTIYAVAWAPDGRSLVFNCQNSKITVAEDARQLRFVKQAATPGISNAAALCYSPDGKFLAAALRLGWEDRDKANGCIALFHTEDMHPRKDVLPPLTGGLLTLDYSPDGRWIAAGGYDGFIYVLDAQTLEIKTWWNPGHGLLQKLRWSPDGRFLASVADADKVAVWPVTW